ncbi:alpha/beta hydrolase [Streptomyces sp. NPDC093970]|uniref:alpha/beta fold hydrolase n=1 Tax=Streptomyces sp. NPDC093970 TaxID=3155076 RepID=UPI003425FD0E
MPTPVAPTDPPSAVAGPLAPGEHSFRLGGITQRYHVHGTGPVCVVHPGGPGLFWDHLRVPALERHLTMVYVEPIGTGGSGRLPSHPHGYTRDRYSRFLQVLINRLSTGKVHLLGHADGALVAAHHALHRPERLAGVILYEGTPEPGPGQGLPDGGRRAAYISGLDEDLRPLRAGVPPGLAAVGLPTLVITGRNTSVDVYRRARELHEAVPGSRLRTAGSEVAHIEEPGRFSRMVHDFVLETIAHDVRADRSFPGAERA